MTEVPAFEVVAPTTRKPNNGSTLISIVLDETGSMTSCWDPTISSFNEYIQSQQNQEGACTVSLTTFSQQGGYGVMPMAAMAGINMQQVMNDARQTGKDIRPVFTNVPVKEVGFLNRDNYKPNGGTNLYDAIGTTIRNIEAQLAPMESVPSVLVVIITDGEENASREYSLDSIRTLIQDREKDGWTFVYLGANQNAWQVGASFGLSKGQTLTYSTSNMKGTMRKLGESTQAYRSVRTATYAACAEAGDFASEALVGASAVQRNFFADEGTAAVQDNLAGIKPATVDEVELTRILAGLKDVK